MALPAYMRASIERIQDVAMLQIYWHIVNERLERYENGDEWKTSQFCLTFPCSDNVMLAMIGQSYNELVAIERQIILLDPCNDLSFRYQRGKHDERDWNYDNT